MALVLPFETNEFFQDADGVWSVAKDYDSTRTYTIDLTDLLLRMGSGVAASSIAATANGGITLAASSLSSPNVTLTVTGAGGYVDVEITTDASPTQNPVFRLGVYETIR